VSRLSVDLRRHVRLVTLLNPASGANFTFHFTDLFADKRRADDVPILPELAKLTGTRVLCVYGVDEKESLCPLIPPGTARIVAKPGGHHFDEDYPALAKLILDESKEP
jgi:type IV secretory pathway VirJ component